MTQVLLCGAAVVTLSMGIRHGFGLFLQPLTMDRGWSRETFAFAIAIQNLAWGLAGIFAGMAAGAEEHGQHRDAAAALRHQGVGGGGQVGGGQFQVGALHPCAGLQLLHAAGYSLDGQAPQRVA